MDYLKNNIDDINNRIVKACSRSGRRPSEITLVAVSKTVDVETVKKAYELGLNNFGENRVQQLTVKTANLPQAKWHMIGRLQTNKVKDVVGKVVLIHSLDRWKLAEELDKRAGALNMTVNTLLQVNISGEEQKAGIEPDDIEYFLNSVGTLNNLRIWGFMTMAPLLENVEMARPIFRELNSIKERLSKREYKNVDLKYLSMGMSQDFEIAIEEGANIVRIGSSIFSE